MKFTDYANEVREEARAKGPPREKDIVMVALDEIVLHVPDCPMTNFPPDEPCVCEHWGVPRDTPEGSSGQTLVEYLAELDAQHPGNEVPLPDWTADYLAAFDRYLLAPANTVEEMDARTDMRRTVAEHVPVTRTRLPRV